MSAVTEKTANFFSGMALQDLVSWGKAEVPSWIFAIKISLAALLAMGISMRLELDRPRTAMITVFVVMQPQTGLVLAKSLYRIGATIAGIFVSLLLVSLFAQHGELFILGLALWVGLCTAGAAFYRNFRSYGFVLAGYTAAMVGFPAALTPTTFFSLAVTRLSEVTLGILCAGVVSDLVFPRRLSDVITSNVQNRYVDFITFVRASLSGTMGSWELARMRLRLISDVIALESIRSAAVLEDPEVRSRDFRLRKLNSEFMAASTTFYSYHQLLKRLTKNRTLAGQALTILYESLGKTLVSEEIPRSAQDAHLATRRIAASRVLLSRRVREVQLHLSGAGDPQSMLDFETAVTLLFRFLRELYAYTRTYATLPEEIKRPKPPDDIRFAVRTDPVIALLTGGRAFVAILLTGTFWIASAWPYGTSALLNASIVSALFATTPDPPRTAKQIMTGFTCGCLVAFMFKFFVIPYLDGFVLLGASMAPLLFIGAYISTRPQLAGIGLGSMVLFTYMTSPANSMQFNMVDFINDGIATIMGVAMAGVMFSTLIPTNGAWLKRRVARQLRHQVIMACFDPLTGLAHRFESSTRDLLQRQAATRKVTDAHDRFLMAWMFSVIEIGRAVIHVRQDADSIQMPQFLSSCIQECIRSTALFFRKPSDSFRAAAITCVANTSEVIRLEVELAPYCRHTRNVLRRMLTSLHLIRTALLDEETVWRTRLPVRQPPITGVTSHAS